VENALRRCKRKVRQEEIIKEVKRHAFYLKPGQKKRIKSVLARKRNRKKHTHDGEPEVPVLLICSACAMGRAAPAVYLKSRVPGVIVRSGAAGWTRLAHESAVKAEKSN
jgi:small subunit ribosomal protein S21